MDISGHADDVPLYIIKLNGREKSVKIQPSTHMFVFWHCAFGCIFSCLFSFCGRILSMAFFNAEKNWGAKMENTDAIYERLLELLNCGKIKELKNELNEEVEHRALNFEDEEFDLIDESNIF